jgi:hypothetical protein
VTFAIETVKFAIENVEQERRSKNRYPVKLNVRYRTIASGSALVGIGRTLNVSSGGFLIASEQEFVHQGSRLRVHLDWPTRLHGTTPLQLIAVCQVVRSQKSEFAVRMERYQFRTRRV